MRCRGCSRAFLAPAWERVGVGLAAAALLGAAPLLLRTPEPAPADVAPWPREEPTASEASGIAPAGAASFLPHEVLTEAAEKGDCEAQTRLGLALLQEYRTTARQPALEEALRWLKAAAETGDPRAQLELGVMHQQGSGLIEDYAEAARWFREAARRGRPEAMVRLGGMLLTGQGGPKDLGEAYSWLNLAAARGERSAETARDRVRALLDEGHLAAAQARSRVLDREVPRL